MRNELSYSLEAASMPRELRQVAVRIMHKALLPTLDCPPGLLLIWKGVNLCPLIHRCTGAEF